MKESIGGTASLNIALAFISIVFAFLAATLSYYKAFKINNIITNSIEKYEGYNSLSIKEINEQLTSIGYQRYDGSCAKEKKFNGKEYVLVKDSDIPNSCGVSGICVYFYNDGSSKMYQYGITTYMTINIPIVSEFVKIPINTVTKEIYGCYGKNTEYGGYNCN